MLRGVNAIRPLIGTHARLQALVLLVQEASRQSSADLTKIKLYDFNSYGVRRDSRVVAGDGDEMTGGGGRWGAVQLNLDKQKD